MKRKIFVVKTYALIAILIYTISQKSKNALKWQVQRKENIKVVQFFRKQKEIKKKN